jgi:hypothetical protein
MTETILGVPVKAAPKEPMRVLDTVVDLTDTPKCRHRDHGAARATKMRFRLMRSKPTRRPQHRRR